jgi:hypothetical protein
MNNEQDLEPTAQPLWELVSLADYDPPREPPSAQPRRRWVAFKRWFGAGKPDTSEALVKDTQDRRRPSAAQLDALAGPIDWRPAAEALQQVLSDCPLGEAGCPPVRFVILPPLGDHTQLLSYWARQQGARWIQAPSEHDLFSDGRDWLANWPADNSHHGDPPFVLAQLERCWRRQAGALALVRRLMSQAIAGRLGPGLIGCDSWAWAFLREMAPMPSAGVLTFQACDGPRLSRLFQELAAPALVRSEQQGSSGIRFRDAKTGQRVLTLGQVELDQDATDDGGRLLQQLAAEARGNPEIARQLWRERLRLVADADANQAEARDGLFWVDNPSDAPALPDAPEEELALLLHALLLHNGLPTATLAEILPLEPVRIESLLAQLREAAVLSEHDDERWRISAPAYQNARDWLRGRGFLSDDL